MQNNFLFYQGRSGLPPILKFISTYFTNLDWLEKFCEIIKMSSSFSRINVQVIMFKRSEFLHIHRSVFFFRLRRKIFKTELCNALRWPGWSFFKTTTTIRTNILQNISGAFCTIRAFKSADHCFIAVIG